MKFGQALKVEEKKCLQGNRLEFQDYFVDYKRERGFVVQPIRQC